MSTGHSEVTGGGEGNTSLELLFPRGMVSMVRVYNLIKIKELINFLGQRQKQQKKQ